MFRNCEWYRGAVASEISQRSVNRAAMLATARYNSLFLFSSRCSDSLRHTDGGFF
jgi:hypothetical protein